MVIRQWKCENTDGWFGASVTNSLRQVPTVYFIICIYKSINWNITENCVHLLWLLWLHADLFSVFCFEELRMTLKYYRARHIDLTNLNCVFDTSQDLDKYLDQDCIRLANLARCGMQSACHIVFCNYKCTIQLVRLLRSAVHAYNLYWLKPLHHAKHTSLTHISIVVMGLLTLKVDQHTHTSAEMEIKVPCSVRELLIMKVHFLHSKRVTWNPVFTI